VVSVKEAKVVPKVVPKVVLKVNRDALKANQLKARRMPPRRSEKTTIFTVS